MEKIKRIATALALGIVLLSVLITFLDFSWMTLPDEYFVENLKRNLHDGNYLEKLEKSTLYYYVQKLREISEEKILIRYRDKDTGKITSLGTMLGWYNEDEIYVAIPSITFITEQDIVRYEVMGSDGRPEKKNIMVRKGNGLEFNTAFSERVLSKINKSYLEQTPPDELLYEQVPDMHMYQDVPEEVVKYFYHYGKAYKLFAQMVYDSTEGSEGRELKRAFSSEKEWWRVYYPMLREMDTLRVLYAQNPFVIPAFISILWLMGCAVHKWSIVPICEENIDQILESKIKRVIFCLKIRSYRKKQKAAYDKQCEELLKEAKQIRNQIQDKDSVKPWMDILEDATSDIKSKQQMLQKLKDRLIQEQTPVRIRTAYWLKDDLPNGNGSIAKRTKKQDPNQEQRKQILKKIQNWGGSGSLTEDFIKSLGKNKLDLLEEIFDLLNGNKELKRAFLDLRPSRMSSYLNSKQSNFYKAVEAKDVEVIKSILLDS